MVCGVGYWLSRNLSRGNDKQQYKLIIKKNKNRKQNKMANEKKERKILFYLTPIFPSLMEVMVPLLRQFYHIKLAKQTKKQDFIWHMEPPFRDINVFNKEWNGLPTTQLLACVFNVILGCVWCLKSSNPGLCTLCKDSTTELHPQSFSQESALDLVTHFLTMNWLWKYLRFCFTSFSGPASHSLRETKKKVTQATTTYTACPGFTVTWGHRPCSHFDSSLWDTLSPKTQLNYDCTSETQN